MTQETRARLGVLAATTFSHRPVAERMVQEIVKGEARRRRRQQHGFARLAGLALALLLWPALAHAQAVTNYTFKVCVQGSDCGTPVTTYVIPATEVVCSRQKSPPPGGIVSNPRYVDWDDPAAPSTADCRWDSGASSGPLFSLPFSTTIVYVSTLTAVNSAGVPSPESAPSNPFNRPGLAPAARTGLRVTGS